MENQDFSKNDYTLFGAIVFGWVFWLWFGFILTLIGIFFQPVLWIGAAIIISIGTYYIRTHKLHTKISREFISICIISAAIAIAVASFSTPTIFSGRDQGSYSLAAIHLATQHALTFSHPAADTFFHIYGPGKALNFPGFDYAENGALIPQFPLGYISWLASLFAIFGLSGIILANSFTVFLFLIAFYLLLRLFVSQWYAIWGFIISATSLPIIWFSKITLSENLALPFFTLLSLNLILFFKKKRLSFYISSIAIASFFAFTRIEGILFLAITVAILGFSPLTKELWKQKSCTLIILPAIIFALFFILDFFANLPFYKAIAKAFIRQGNTAATPLSLISDSTQSLFSLIHIFWIYGLLIVFILGITSVLIFFKRRQPLVLIPFLLAFPTFFYLLQPNISSDHPWMLRRFLFSIWPSLLFSAIIGIALIQTFLTKKYSASPFFKKHYYSGTLFTILLLSQLPIAFRYATFSENKGLLEQTHILAQNFTETDLILIDRLATGNSWAMIPEALQIFENKNAVYFFNPEDLEKIDTSRFSNVYLVVSDNEAHRYLEVPRKQLTPVSTYSFSTEILNPENDAILPQKTTMQTEGTIFKIQ